MQMQKIFATEISEMQMQKIFATEISEMQKLKIFATEISEMQKLKVKGPNSQANSGLMPSFGSFSLLNF